MSSRPRIPPQLSTIDKGLLLAHILKEEDEAEWACIIYELLVSLGEVSAMVRLADILSEPPRYLNVPRAKELYKEACIKGDYSGCYNLGVLLEQLGDTVEAQRYYKLARSRSKSD